MPRLLLVILTLFSAGLTAQEYQHSFAANPLRLLANPTVVGGSGETYTFTYSLINKQGKKEHAFPVFFGTGDDLEVTTIEYQSRFYSDVIGDGANMYFGYFIRVAHLDGLERGTYEPDSTTKWGIGAVLGWTYFEQDNLFLTGNLQIGGYTSGKSSHFVYPGFNFSEKHDRQLILNLELFKVGYVF